MNAEHKTPEWLKFVDHTADAGIAVEALDLARLFERAAWGMFSVITDVAAARATETSRISIDAPDRVALLVRWLSELNYRHITEHRIFSKFEVVTLSEQHLEADVRGEIFDPARHTIFTEIKAVTFHDLQVERDERGWKAQIILTFDDAMDYGIRKLTDYLWELPKSGGMRVPARIYATEEMIAQIVGDKAPQQAANVAHLPGIVTASLAMPDIHWGYGFPIGGVAAFDLDEGVISPGGVGYDINCGVRLMASRLTREQVEPRLRGLVNQLFRDVPTGVGAAGALTVPVDELRWVVERGASWAVEHGYGSETDLAHIEEHGCIAGADPAEVSHRAWQRGREQLGTLGSGNHFLEVGYVAEIYDAEAARALGLQFDEITVIIHCGSRGFGYQVCDDYLGVMDSAVKKYHIALPDRQLACAPVDSPEGRRYLGAMRCAVNYAFANRQVIAHHTRKAFETALGMSAMQIGLRTVYEVAHNIAKFETHSVDGRERRLCVHRKGATRAFAPGCGEVPPEYRAIGQPVLIPGDMGRYSYVLTGSEKAMHDTFGSTCHGAGRAMSRVKARQAAAGRNIIREMEERGIIVRGQSRRTVDEEISEAYKDVSNVVDACALAGISRKVAQLRPIGCIKG